MNDLNELLRPQWGSEQWINEGWQQISREDKALIKTRVDDLFKEGLPFEIKHDKLLYVYAFSLLAQLEVLAIQIPLKFKDQMTSQENQQRMHQQLLDEIFHGLVFTKILYQLSAPYGLPPEYSEQVERLCNFVRQEECPKVAIMLLNLVAEGWIEEAFKCYAQYNIAPKVFRTILADEHRHVCEADLYQDVGLPDLDLLKNKLESLEEHLLVHLFLQHKYMFATSALLGVNGTLAFLQALNAKHQQQLNKIGLTPSAKWVTGMQLMHEVFPKIHQYAQTHEEIAFTPLRKAFLSQWNNSAEATMVSQCNIHINCIEFFNKKYPSETLTTLMLQTVSIWLKENAEYRTYLNYKKLYRSQEAYVGVIVKLPGCQDHIGTIIFENCHTLSAADLAQRVRTILPMMVYCYQKREELEKAHPHLTQAHQKNFLNGLHETYAYPFPGSAVMTVSNVGACGYTDAKSPLFKNEAVKFVMLEVERKQVWSQHRQEFVIEDILPLSISADHRIFDGNTPVPKMLDSYFQEMFKKMINDEQTRTKTPASLGNTSMISAIERLLSFNLNLAYESLNALQTIWPDFFTPDELLASLQEFQA